MATIMARRRVKRTDKNRDGDITALCNRNRFWSPRSKRRAISDIEGDQHTYYVRENGRSVDIIVADGPNGKYLRTDPDATTSNNLDDLPDC